MSHAHLLTATLAIIDVETTGLSPENDRVVEIACLRVERGRIVDRLATLVDPGIAIPPSASAVHGIFDRDVAGTPRLESLVDRIEVLARGATIIAHNARFDLGFLPFLAHRPAICTLQLARRLVDAPNYRNDFLCDYLQLAIDRDALIAHRAESDAHVTAELAAKLFGYFIERTREPTMMRSLIFSSARCFSINSPLDRTAASRYATSLPPIYDGSSRPTSPAGRTSGARPRSNSRVGKPPSARVKTCYALLRYPIPARTHR